MLMFVKVSSGRKFGGFCFLLGDGQDACICHGAVLLAATVTLTVREQRATP
jgi:hypothetical protein